jgi:hypothetical protein
MQRASLTVIFGTVLTALLLNVPLNSSAQIRVHGKTGCHATPSRKHSRARPGRHARNCRGRTAPSQVSATYWGSGAIGTQFTGSEPPWGWNALIDFQRIDAGGKPVSVLGWGSQWYSAAYCGGYCSFTTSLYSSVRNNGDIPWLSWSSTSSTGSSGYTDAQIAAGSQDSYITQWAQAAKAWGHPFFLRFDWEMNGNWFPWSPGVNGNTAADYVAMWQHVHRIFTSVGATNVTWVWCPNVDPGNYGASVSGYSLASMYPGDAYVDWTALDGYNVGDPWTSFTSLFSSTYKLITDTIAPSKPMIIGEVGSTEAGGSKAQWITAMFSALPTSFPKIRGLLWYDVFSSGRPFGATDWPIDSSSASEAAFSGGIADSAYTSNVYANLGNGPIAPPS